VKAMYSDELCSFTARQAEDAYDIWRSNCGPAALAAILGRSLEDIRPMMGDFEKKFYTNPTLMCESLTRCGVKWRRVAVCELSQIPARALVRVQWEGPWMTGRADGCPVPAYTLDRRKAGCNLRRHRLRRERDVGGWLDSFGDVDGQPCSLAHSIVLSARKRQVERDAHSGGSMSKGAAWDLTSVNALQSAAEWMRKKSGAMLVIFVRADDLAISADPQLAPRDSVGLLEDRMPELHATLQAERTRVQGIADRKRERAAR
jgi:hypothetical protein